MSLIPDVDLPQTAFDPSTTIKKGFCQVSTKSSRHPEKHRLYYEIHGDSSPKSKKLVFIMGLNNSSFAWANQVHHFGHLKNYQVLVFDNRGVGSSDSPSGLYKTSEMAQDTVELLDFVGWNEQKSLNVIGVSMGGMTALELATLIPSRINSLILTSTKAGGKFEFPALPVLNMFTRLSFGLFKDIAQAVSLICSVLYPKEYLDQYNEEKKMTNREFHETDFTKRFALTKRQTVQGRLGQMGAVFSHHVSDVRLHSIGKNIEKVFIIHGDQDLLVNVERGKELHQAIPGSHFKLIEGGGHALPSQIDKEFNEWIAEIVNS